MSGATKEDALPHVLCTDADGYCWRNNRGLRRSHYPSPLRPHGKPEFTADPLGAEVYPNLAVAENVARLLKVATGRRLYPIPMQQHIGLNQLTSEAAAETVAAVMLRREIRG